LDSGDTKERDLPHMARLSWLGFFAALFIRALFFSRLPHRFQYQITCGSSFFVARGDWGLSLSAAVLFGISDVANVAPLTVGRAQALHLKGELRYQIQDTFFDLEMVVVAELPAPIIGFVAHPAQKDYRQMQ